MLRAISSKIGSQLGLIRLASVVIAGLFLLATWQNLASAQLLQGAAKAKAQTTNSLETLIDAAKEDGSTIIMIKPEGVGDAANAADESGMRAEQLLKIRSRLTNIAKSAPTLIESSAATLFLAGDDGTLNYIFRGLITALAGLFLAWLITRPVQNWFREHFRHMYDPDPQTTADKYRYLLFRAVLAVVYAAIYFVVALFVALIFDPGNEATRRLIFETIAAFCAYRFLRYAVSWNLFAYDVPTHRLVNLTDQQAIRIHNGFVISGVLAVSIALLSRFFVFTGLDLEAKGISGGVNGDHRLLILIFAAALLSLIVSIYTIITWKEWQRAFGPTDEQTGAAVRVWRTISRMTPFLWLLYTFLALGMFVVQLTLNKPAPALVIFAPYLTLWIAIVTYGIILIIIQAIYQRRQRTFDEKVANERARLAEEAAELDTETGERMIVASANTQFEYRPVFRSFFENGALAIIITVALGELGRAWGISVAEKGNLWASVLDMALAGILCWLAYRAVTLAIDRRLDEEAGPDEIDDDELGGEGGGAGASRMATLLPIFRYIVTVFLFSIAFMVILSRLGFDIGPIFAGAGVVGIAVGFGAQTLIRDIFSGAFFLLDDAFRKGEYVEIEGIKGVVEKISVRSFQLRHHLGALHTIPFGEIRQLTNYSRDWVMMKLPLRVTYDTDVEKVRKLVKKLGQRLLDHPQIGHSFLQPLKSQGVYKMEDSAMIIRVKFMTPPGEQFVTRKVVYQEIQDLFAREGIKFAHKEVTVRLADGQKIDELSEAEKEAASAAARSVIDAEEEEQAAAGKKPSDR